MLKHIAKLLAEFPESPSVQKVWSIVRHELFLCSQAGGGLTVSWGQGLSGQLGFGRDIQLLSHPMVIPRLASTRIAQIAVGADHILAIDANRRLYSWGNGGGGRLGHGDFEKRFYPTIIEYFGPYNAEYCAAGDAHSAVMTTNRKAQRETQTKRVITFGRNGHGRLGNGKTNNSNKPIGVDRWPPSMQNCKPRQVACGGAHTLCLLYREVPKTLANPWAVETIVAAWGYIH